MRNIKEKDIKKFEKHLSLKYIYKYRLRKICILYADCNVTVKPLFGQWY
jgi:hypothetical protein